MLSAVYILLNVVAFAAALVGTIILISGKTSQRYRIFCVASFVMITAMAWIALQWEHHIVLGVIFAVGALCLLLSAIKYWNRNPYVKRSNSETK